MNTLAALADEARALAAGELTAAESEVARQMRICNGCRYCEGFCAVFPAMTRRLEFGKADLHYMANLCHNCGACLHACQYAPPHEFAIDVPRAMARVRVQTWGDYAWPSALGALYRRNGATLAVALAAGLSVFLALAVARTGSLWGAPAAGSFYAVFPHGLMVGMFAPIFLFAVLALAIGVHRFWREITPVTGDGAPVSAPAAAEASHDALRLRYLDGGHGEGCHEEDDGWTHARRRAHHLTFYGFALCFAATSVATVYHYAFGWVAPYGYGTLPKLLGLVGGVMLMAGTGWLWRLHRRRHPDHVVAEHRTVDRGFIALLFLTALTGLLLMLARGTAAVPLLLSIHLGTVMALFLTMPYGKFAHGIFRSAALLRFAVEKRQPARLGLGGD